MLLSCSDKITIHDLENSTKNYKITTKEIPQNKNLKKINMSIFNHNSRVIAAGGDNGVINFFNTSLEYISCIDDSEILATDVTSLSFNINSNYLGYSSSGGFLKIWDLKSSVVQLNYKLSGNYVTSMCFNSDSSILTAGTNKGEIVNFNIPTMSKSNAKLQLTSKINFVKYSPFYSTYIAASFVDSSIKIIDTSTGNIVNNFTGYHQGEATGICYSPINKLFLTSVGADGKINFYDILARKHIKTITTNTPLTSVSFNTDGQTIAVGDKNGGILIYDLRNSSTPKLTISDHNSSINHLEFSVKMSKSQNLNTSGVLNSSRVDLNSSRINKSFNSQDASIQYPLHNQLNNSQFQNNDESTKNQNEYKINLEQNKQKNSDTARVNQTEFSNPKENIKKTNEINNSIPKNKKKDGDISQVFQNESNIIANDPKNMNKPTFPLTNNLNNERILIDFDKEKKMSKNVDPSINLKPTNINTNDELDNKTQNFIKTCLETEMGKMKQFIHEEINSLHVDLIRQFEIQHAELIKSMKNFSLVNNKMAKEIEKLKKENTNLKSQFF